MLRSLFLTLALLVMAPPVVMAQTVQDQIVSQLVEQGYDDISVSRTLLGRVRVVAMSEAYRREIVFIPGTGEILRDYLVALGDGRPTANIFDPGEGDNNRQQASGSGGDDDNNDGNDDGSDDGSDDGGDDGSDDGGDDGGDNNDDQSSDDGEDE